MHENGGKKKGSIRIGVNKQGDLPNHCTVPSCLSAAVTVPGGIVAETTVIKYTYDPLYRLTNASYDNGDSFAYTYDSTGNRLTKETMNDEQSVVNNYQYDVANRLTDVDGVSYTWDADERGKTRIFSYKTKKTSKHRFLSAFISVFPRPVQNVG